MSKRKPLGRIVTVGYRGKTWEQIDALLMHLQVDITNSFVADIRDLRSARCQDGWRGRQSRETVQECGYAYLWFPELGNTQRKLPWIAPDWDTAVWCLNFLARQLRDGQTVVLLCACEKAVQCHRSEVAEELAQRTGAGVTHL